MANNVSDVKEDGHVGRANKGVRAEAGNCGRCGVEVDGAKESGKVDEEGAKVSGVAKVGEASYLLPLAFLGPLNVTVGSSRFQQFFFIYAKLMAGLRLSKDLEFDVTPLALHKAVIKAGNPSLEESCWAVIKVWWEMR